MAHIRKPHLAIVAFAALSLLLAACAPKSDYQVVRQGGWKGGVPKPTGEVLLTVVTPDGEYPLDKDALEKLRWVRIKTIHHSAENGPPAVFEGVWLSDLLAGVGTPDPKRLRFEASDDYVISVEWEKIKRFQPMIALTQDGKPLPPVYAPLRIVFPYDRLKPDPTEYNAYWVWKLTRIVVYP